MTSDAAAPTRVPRLSYFFPAHNEEANLEGLVAEALEVLPTLADTFEIIAVDDGSRDGTPALADALSAAHPGVVRAVHHPTNLGYGAALRSGFGAARYELVAFTDGDRQFKVADIGRLTERLAAADMPDVVVGYRIKRADPLIRTLYARAYRLANRIFFGLKVTDVDCACKLFRREALEGLRVELGGAFFSAEIVERAYSLGAVDYLVKPVPPVVLRAKVAGFIDLFLKTEQARWQADRLLRLERGGFERSLAEENARLRASERRFRTLASSAPVGIFETDANGNCLFVNDRWCRITGMTPGTAGGEGWVRALHPDDRDRVCREWYAAPGGGGSSPASTASARPRAGRWVPACRRPSGRGRRGHRLPRHGRGHHGPAAADEALRESEQRLRALSDNLPDGAVYQVVGDPEGAAVRYISAGVERLFGVTPAEAMADATALYGLVHEEDRPRWPRPKRSPSANGPVRLRVPVQTRVGRGRGVHCRSAPRRLPTGETVWEGIVTDADRPPAGRGGPAGGRPAEGRVPGDAGPRAAQPAGPDPQRRCRSCGGRRRPPAVGAGPGDDGPAGRAHGPDRRRPARRVPDRCAARSSSGRSGSTWRRLARHGGRGPAGRRSSGRG